MKQEFEPHVIAEAVEKSYQISGDLPMLDVSINGLRAFLDALPEPQDEWIECAFEDIQKGDRVRMVQAGRTTDFHLPVIEAHPTHLVLQDNTQCSNFHKAVYCRIPAPVHYPNPSDHPAIVVIEAREDTFTGPSVFVWTGGRYENEDFTFDEDDITKWHPIDPAKVVADND